MCDSASTTTPETPWCSNRWNATSITVARDAFAAPIIISRTASTFVSAAASQPDNSHTMCVPSAFNFSGLLDLGGIPPPDLSAGACCAASRPRPIDELLPVLFGARAIRRYGAKRARLPPTVDLPLGDQPKLNTPGPANMI